MIGGDLTQFNKKKEERGQRHLDLSLMPLVRLYIHQCLKIHGEIFYRESTLS
jgi:hypothetical protein